MIEANPPFPYFLACTLDESMSALERGGRLLGELFRSPLQIRDMLQKGRLLPFLFHGDWGEQWGRSISENELIDA